MSQFFGFLCLGYPNRKKEIELIYESIRKVLDNLEDKEYFVKR